MEEAHAQPDAPAKKGRRGKRDAAGDDGRKRRCISSACVPCRKRKSKVREADLAVMPFSGAPAGLRRFALTQREPSLTCNANTVRRNHASLFRLRRRLQHRVHLRPQLGPPPQGRLQEGH